MYENLIFLQVSIFRRTLLRYVHLMSSHIRLSVCLWRWCTLRERLIA